MLPIKQDLPADCWKLNPHFTDSWARDALAHIAQTTSLPRDVLSVVYDYLYQRFANRLPRYHLIGFERSAKVIGWSAGWRNQGNAHSSRSRELFLLQQTVNGTVPTEISSP